MSTQHIRYHASLNGTCYPIKIGTENRLPSVYHQADQLGGQFTRVIRGLPFRSVANFSPSLIKYKNHDLIAWRSQPEPFCFRWDMKYFYYNSTPTDVYVGELVDDTTVVGAKKIRDKKHRLSYEDPRLFVDSEDNLMCQFITSTYASRWDTTKHKMLNQPKVMVGELNKQAECVNCFYPPIGGNLVAGKPEKNWCFFNDGEHDRLLYMTQPLIIITPGEDQITIDSSVLKRVTGDAPTFNSTAPVKIGDEWIVFYHWKLMAKVPNEERPVLMYFLSCYCLDEKLTKITRYLPEPMFTGSPEDELITWTDQFGNPVSKQPACILPFGATVDETGLALSLGINDNFMGIFRMGLNDLLALMDKV